MRFLVLLLGLTAALGCGDGETPVGPVEEPVEEPVSPSEAARAELDRRGISYDADAFMTAASAGYLETVKLFVDAGMSVNTVTNDSLRIPVLHVAARGGHLEVVRYLVGQGAVMTARDNEGETALIAAAKVGHLEVVRYLVGQGADVTARDNEGETALLWAAFPGGHLEVVRYLVGQGADVNARQNEGATALMAAAGTGHLVMVRYLVSQGADVNARSNEGLTALFAAAVAGHREVWDYLLENGVNLDAFLDAFLDFLKAVDRELWEDLVEIRQFIDWEIIEDAVWDSTGGAGKTAVRPSSWGAIKALTRRER